MVCKAKQKKRDAGDRSKGWLAYQKNVLHPMNWFPVFLECIDTNCSILGHIWVEYLGQEVA